MRTILYAVFVLSGAAGLIYESIWARYLGLFVGHSAFAQVIVLVIFMGGMSVGALLVGERSSRLRSPLIWYAAVELAAGIIGIAFHDAFGALTQLAYGRVFPSLGPGPLELVVKWSMAGLLILPQSVLLGATFPLMSAGVVRLAPERAGRSLAVLYFSNSFGAALGVLVSGFLLVAYAGLPGTLIVAAMLNVFVALIVFVAARRREAGSGMREAPEPLLPALASHFPLPASRVLLLVAFGTAVASFIYEIAWVRMLSLVLGSATHSFELMLSAFILGLSLGAFWVRTRVDTASLRLLAFVQIAMGALAIATLPVYLASFEWMASAMSVFARTDEGYQALSIFRYALCLAVMLPATFCAGMTLPVITRLLLSAGAGERAIGRVYGVNTFGSIVGVTLASLVLMPVLGLKWLLVLGGAVDVALGAWLFAIDRRDRPQRVGRWLLAGAALATIALIAILTWAKLDSTVLTSGVFRYGTSQALGKSSVVFYRDGRTASVSVRKSTTTGSLSLATNGKPDASLGPEWLRPHGKGEPPGPFTYDASTQALLALIPLAHVPDARQAAVIGQGSGMTSHMVLGSPVLERLVTIEIEPEMIEASQWFLPANRRVFEDARSTFALDDARSFFTSAGRRYDVIVSEPSNPWVAGVSGLFTTEFYALVSKHLTDDGVLAQWLHVTEIDDRLVLSVVAAIARNFPSYALFALAHDDVLIVASTRATLPSPDWSIVQRFAFADDLSRITPMTPHFFETLRLGDNRSLARLAERAAPNSDFYPILDLNAERTRYTQSHAVGFSQLGAERFSVSLALSGTRSGFGTETRPTIPNVPRLSAAVIGASLRGRSDHSMNEYATQAAFRHGVLRQSLAGSRDPVDWKSWTQAIALMDSEIHGGTAGVADTAFYSAVERFLRRTSPPPEARASIAFLRALSGWDFEGAARASEPLIAAARRGDLWVDPDVLRDGSTTACVMLGDTAGARAAFVALAPYARRAAEDVRTRLLESLLRPQAISSR
jgi:predicted membrane-bound spermidine synthase